MSVLLTSMLACIPDTGHPAPTDAQLNPTPDEYTLDAGFAGELDDGQGYLLMIDAQVSSANDIPLADIEVEFVSEFAGLYLVPEAAIREVDAPDPDALGADCDLTSESYDAENCAWYDLQSEMYFELSPSYSGDYKPNYMVSKTDRFGNARIWVYVDTFPTGDAGFLAAFVTAKITSQNSTITFTPDLGG